MTEGRTASHTYACPEAWDAPVETVSPWSAWTVSGSTCVNCPAPSTQSETQWVASSASCPAGQYGGTSWEREEARSRGVSYNCPAGTTALPPATVGSWSAWSATGATRNVAGACVTCPAPVPQTETQWVNASAACPSGQVGSHTWEAQQSRARNGSYNCPAGTSTLPAATWSAWSAWANTGARRNEVNTCAPSAPNCGGTPVEPTPICSFVIYAGAATSAANCSAGNYNWTPGSPTGYWCHLHVHIDPGYSCSFVTATACPAP